MSVKYTLTKKGNPRKPEIPKKFHATAKADGEITFFRLSKQIAAQTNTVSDADAMVMLKTLNKLLIKQLAEGNIVRFGDFGSFQISISSAGADSPQEFTTSKIRGAKIIFRPGSDAKAMLAALEYEEYKE